MTVFYTQERGVLPVWLSAVLIFVVIAALPYIFNEASMGPLNEILINVVKIPNIVMLFGLCECARAHVY